MPPRQSTKKFIDLKKKWDLELKKSGFVDIELDNNQLKRSSHQFTLVDSYSETAAIAKQEYYRMAGHFLYENEWDTKEERLIWSMHAEGMPIRKIVKEMNKKGYKTYRRLVHEQLQELCNLMKLKYKTYD